MSCSTSSTIVSLTSSNLSSGRCFSRLQRREDAHQRRPSTTGRASLLMAERELHVVRIQHADPAEPVPERKRLRLELDAIVALDLRPDVDLGGRLQVLVAELEDHLRLPGRKTVLVGDAPAQDERVVVEPEIGVSRNSTSRIWSGASTKSSVENVTPCWAAGSRMTFAKSNRLFREVKWLGLR